MTLNAYRKQHIKPENHKRKVGEIDGVLGESIKIQIKITDNRVDNTTHCGIMNLKCISVYMDTERIF
jgi:hypothetical protein